MKQFHTLPFEQTKNHHHEGTQQCVIKQDSHLLYWLK